MPADCCEITTVHPEKIGLARRAMPSAPDLEDAGELLKVLADATRLRLIAAMLEVELCVCDLAEVVGMSQSAVSHQLRVLRQSRLVRLRREGRSSFYSLRDEHVQKIVQTALAHVREMYQPDSESRDLP